MKNVATIEKRTYRLEEGQSEFTGETIYFVVERIERDGKLYQDYGQAFTDKNRANSKLRLNTLLAR